MTLPAERIEEIKRAYPSLLMRVRDGNDKIIQAWLKVNDMEDKNIFDVSMDKIEAAVKTLTNLCLQLEAYQEVLQGKGDCLYIMNKHKTRPCTNFEKTPKGKTVETFCWVCPSAYPYWQEEWSEFIRAFKVKGERTRLKEKEHGIYS